MIFLLSRSLRFLCGLLPVLPMIAAYHFIRRRAGRSQGVRPPSAHLLGTYLFCAYLSAVFFVTDIPDALHIRLEPSINLIPFDDILTNTIQYGLNILLFVPLGFLLPMLWERFTNKRLVIVYGAALSLFIELFQLFNYRATDIDDLLMNTAGAIAGYFLFRWVKGRFPGWRVFSADGCSWRGEPLLYFFFTWASFFFLQPALTRRLAGLIFAGRVIIG